MARLQLVNHFNPSRAVVVVVVVVVRLLVLLVLLLGVQGDATAQFLKTTRTTDPIHVREERQHQRCQEKHNQHGVKERRFPRLSLLWWWWWRWLQFICFIVVVPPGITF